MENRIRDSRLRVMRKRPAFTDLSNSHPVLNPSKMPAEVKPVVASSMTQLSAARQIPVTRFLDRIPEHDKPDLGDARLAAEYVAVVFQNIRNTISSDLQPLGDYISRSQPDLSERMRAVLVDWLVDVHWKFKLSSETLFLCVSLLDRFLARQPHVPRSQLQLIGATCLLLAAKYEDIYAPEIKDIVHITDKTYTRDEVLQAEVFILNSLRFKLTAPSPLLFLLRMAKLIRSDERQFYLAQYCLELGISDYRMAVTHNSCELAAAAVFLSNKLLRKSPSWPGVLMELTGYHETQLKIIAKEICINLQQLNEATSGANGGDDELTSGSGLRNLPCAVVAARAIKRKFSQQKFLQVAKLIL